MDFIKVPIGYLLGWIYQFTENFGGYGAALIVFTLVVKLILLPLTLKQQKSMTKMQKLQPKLLKIQEKYKNDQQLMSQETMKLYKKYGVSPAGGCLPLLIQLPILFALYRVIYEPLTYMLHMSGDEITALAEQFNITAKGATASMKEILIAGATNPPLIKFDFLGLNLADKPELAKWTTLIIPVLASVTTYLTSKITQWMNQKPDAKSDNKAPEKPQRILSPEQKTNNNANSAESMTKSMTVVMPLFTLWITYTLPMAMGVYWVASNIFSLLQTIFLNGYYSKKFAGELEEIEDAQLAKQIEKHGDKRKKAKLIEKSKKDK
ncbi:MAG: YidC/Oxa1 family membrane protein insertase [Clostridia bacterium]|nr:YidC/Oxa1 family membrane protein insertase [Clostridia bacterium]